MTHPEILQLGAGQWTDPSAAVQREWWLGNGLGGWASGTVAGVNTRGYHGLLAAALHPPADRRLLLARVEDTVSTGGGEFRLCGSRWASGAADDDGLRHLLAFRLSPYPIWTFRTGGWLVERRVFPVHGYNATVIRYRVHPGPGAAPPLTLRLRPWVHARSVHHCGLPPEWAVEQAARESAVSLRLYPGAPVLHLLADGGAYHPAPARVYGVFYPAEAERGLQAVEDVLAPGEFRWSADGPAELTLLAGTPPLPPLLEPAGALALSRAAGEYPEPRAPAGGPAPGSAGSVPDGALPPPLPLPPLLGQTLEQREAARVQTLVSRANPPDAFARALVLAGDQFIAHRADTGTATVLAGFPWFTDWGRDTMIALHGLTLTTGRWPLARQMLTTFVRHMRDGLVPNHFPDDGGEPQYNTADATLWLFAAAWRYMERSGDHAFVLRAVYPALQESLRRHRDGTRFGIRATPEGLLRCGSPDLQLTWMDAKVGDWVVTPRDGLPVEIQALWYNALRVTAELARLAGEDPTPAAELAGLCRGAFLRGFWNPAAGCLYDRLADDGAPDPALRPNQLLACSLDFPLVEGEPARQVVSACFQHLFTPYGLRSLAPWDRAYQGRYQGDQRARDGAYHQGTVWAWLLGPFVTAYLNAYGRTPQTRAFCRDLLRPLQSHLLVGAVGSVAEILDGDSPHTGRGCPAQAWSVAEVLRVWVEEL